MKKIALAILLIILNGCSSLPKKQAENDFKIDFGKIIEVGDFYQIEQSTHEFQLVSGKLASKVGVRIENLARNPYDLAFYISKFDETSKEYVEFSQGGYWRISPPTNPNYEAFLWESDKDYEPGSYVFVVIVGNKSVKTIDFTIVNGKS